MMIRLKEKFASHAPPLVGWYLLAACLVALWGASTAFALGTSAGTPIINTATVNYTLGSDPTVHAETASDSFNVQEVIDVVVTWQDAASVPVNSPHVYAALTFLVTNTGNGPEDIELLPNDSVGGDDFDPVFQDIYIESNGTSGWQSTDTIYSGSITFTADQAMTIYVRSNIPAAQANNDIAQLLLRAQALTTGAAGSPAGTQLAGLGFNGVDALVGTTNADGDATGTYEVSAAAVALTKSVIQIQDLFGGNQPYTGARVTYRILVQVTGIGTAEALVVTDEIPTHMTYVNNSLVLDAAPLTDAADTDSGDFNATAPNTVTVNLGDTVAPATHTIEFDTTIN